VLVEVGCGVCGEGLERELGRWRGGWGGRYLPTIQKRLQPIAQPVRDAVRPYWQHPAFVRQRKRARYALWRLRATVLPVLGGEPVPSEVGSYHGTTGFTTAPNSARSGTSGRTDAAGGAAGDGSVTDRSSASRGSYHPSAAVAAADARSVSVSDERGSEPPGGSSSGGGRLRLPRILGLRISGK
jgi:hypothetical protein